MTVMTLNLVEKQPAAMRRIIGKHLAVPRWQETCDYYNQMMERERLTVCFHAQLKQRHATMRFEEMNDVERERLVCAIDELRGAFSKRRQVGASEYAYISFLTVSQRRTLFMHARLTEKNSTSRTGELMKNHVTGVMLYSVHYVNYSVCLSMHRQF